MTFRTFRRIGLGLISCVAAGCFDGADYDGPPRAAVSGRVTLDGEPINGGTIVFLPAAGGDLRSATDSIIEGGYRISEGRGPNHGDYKVEIRWPKPTGKTRRDSSGEEYPQTAEAVPDKYNKATTLTATIDDSEHEFDFDLTSQ